MKSTPALLVLLALFVHSAWAGPIYSHSVSLPLQNTYDKLHTALESHRFYVIFEANVGRNVANFSEQWGEEYNHNQLEGIRSMVFCNPWYANQISNADPTLLALCPLHLTVTHKQGKSTVLMIKPSTVAAGSKGEAIAKELEAEIIKVIEEALP